MPRGKKAEVVNPMDALLQALQKDMERLKYGGKNRDVIWYYPQEGTTIVRILPSVDNIKPFWKVVFRHRIPHPEGYDGMKSVVCYKTFGKDCPICELSEKLQHSGNPLEIDLGKSLRAYARVYFNALILGWKKNPADQVLREPPGMDLTLEQLKVTPVVLVLPYTAGMTVMNLIAQNISIVDPQAGMNISISRTAVGNRTEYTVVPITVPTPIEAWNEVSQKLYDLDTLITEKDPAEVYYDALGGLVKTGHATPTIQVEVQSLQAPVEKPAINPPNPQNQPQYQPYTPPADTGTPLPNQQPTATPGNPTPQYEVVSEETSQPTPQPIPQTTHQTTPSVQQPTPNTTPTPQTGVQTNMPEEQRAKLEELRRKLGGG